MLTEGASTVPATDAAILLLHKMVEDGVLVKQGSSRNLRYVECAPRS